ncbi:MAG: sugar phosphate isomerase/epimerase [Bacteroidota bacterium]
MESTIYTRRDILKLIGTGAAAALAYPALNFAKIKTTAANIGFQLYNVRRQIVADLEGSIQKISGMGYLGVETYPLPSNIDLQRAAKVFKENGLMVFSMHTELPVGDEVDNIMKMSDAYHCSIVVYPGWPKDLSTQDSDLFLRASEIFKTVDKMKQRAEQYNEIGAALKKKGLHFGIHNHWWEFEKSDGTYPSYYFLEHLDPDIFFEIDTYWAKTAGQNPAKVIADFGKRAPFLHIKDGPATKDGNMYSMVPAGSGVMDFPAIVKAGGKNIQWMIVEFDEYAGSIFDGMQGSYTYLTKNNLAKGKV